MNLTELRGTGEPMMGNLGTPRPYPTRGDPVAPRPSPTLCGPDQSRAGFCSQVNNQGRKSDWGGGQNRDIGVAIWVFGGWERKNNFCAQRENY